MPQLAEQINEARRNGYSDDEITGFLKQKADLAPKIQEAVGSGYSSSEILQHLAPPPPVPTALSKFRQEAPRLAGIAMESSGQKLATDLLGGGSKAVMDFITGSPQDPRNTERFLQAGQGLVGFVRDEPHRMADQLQKSGQAMLRGDINAAADHLWFAIPFAGAAGQKMKEYLDQGDVSGALTHAFGTLVPIASKPTVETVRRNAGPAAAYGGGFARGAGEKIIQPGTVGVPRTGFSIKNVPAGETLQRGLVGFTVGKYVGGDVGGAVGASVAAGGPVVRAGHRAGLAARAQAAAKALANERATAAIPTVIPEERRLPSPPDTSYVRAVPADPLPPSRQLPAPGRPAIITPAPDPLAGDTSGVRSVPAVYGSPATNEAAVGMREAMGLQPGELAPPATRAAPIAARASQIDQMARHMRQSGITATQAALLDPPELAALAKAAGVEGPLGKVAVAVRKRLAAMEKAEAETAKYQAAWDKLKPAEKAAVAGEAEAPAVERKPPATAAVAEPTPTTPAEANVELGKQYPAPAPVEGPAAPTASQRRVQGMAAILAEGEIPVEQLRGGLKTDVNARLFLESESQRLGYGKIAPGELDKIVGEVERLRGGRWISEEGHVKDIPDTVHAGQIQLEGHHPGPLEKAMVFDLNTGEQLEHYAGTASSADQSIYGSGKYHSDREVIQMHTHPNQSSFSDGDWKYFSQPNVREMRIIGTDRIYQLKKGKGWDSMDWKERTARKVYDRWNHILDEYAAPGEWDATTMASDVNKQMAKEFGVTFTSMPRTKP